MGWDFLFGLTNAIALIGWLLLLLSSRGPKTMAVLLYGCVGILCLAYLIMFVVSFGGLVDAGLTAGATAGGDFTSIEGIRGLVDSDGGIVIAWTHYLAFDLFVGIWIAKDADHKGFTRLAQLPFLAATLMAGPIGLFAWLIFRERRARALARTA